MLPIILHTLFRIMAVFLALFVIKKCFKDKLGIYAKKALFLCGLFLILDFVIIDIVRFIVDNGVSSALFFPLCLPLCFFTILHYYVKDEESIKKSKTLTLIIGIPLLLLSLFFEIYSFM